MQTVAASHQRQLLGSLLRWRSSFPRTACEHKCCIATDRAIGALRVGTCCGWTVSRSVQQLCGGGGPAVGAGKVAAPHCYTDCYTRPVNRTQPGPRNSYWVRKGGLEFRRRMPSPAFVFELSLST